jgi:malonyl-CoA O-methyltransferase
MRDLKNLGAHNVSAGRPQALTGKGRLQAMRAAYETFRRKDGLLPATYEVVYGHAWAPKASLSTKRENGGAVFPLSQLRRRQR